MKKSIAIDMDNVIADVETHFIDWYEREFGLRIKKEDMHGMSETEAFPDKEAIWRFLFTPGFFRTVPVMPGAQEAVKKLMENFEVYIVSAAMEFPQSLPEKHEWLQEHFPFISWRNIIFCGDKSIIATDFMIDDHMKNLSCCRGKGIMFTASHNIKLDHDCRVNSWQEALDFLDLELKESVA
ncbi:5' nucleotidase, NT5C type [Rubrolithibacter danxiaensis]|uniref:5' nucleotidase, NT5C type n=1 Tax=Rubrolithibacter danxiaensis TaxID=3390805 RepID=UPI003BF8D881